MYSAFTLSVLGILFPDDGDTCRKYDNTSEEQCLEEKSYYLSGETLCSWSEKHARCDLRPPPSSFVFYAVVTFLMTVITILPSLFYKYLLEEICVCRPILEDVGLSTEKWFRIGVNRSAIKASSGVKVDSNPNRGRESVRLSGLGKALKLSSDSKINRPPSLFDEVVIQRLRYFDFNTVEDELYYMSQFITSDIWHESYFLTLPWRKEDALLKTSIRRRYDIGNFKRTEAVRTLLNLQADGSAIPLTMFQSIRYRNARHRVKQKIIRSRRDSATIISKLTGLDDLSEGDEKDAALMQFFIVEQFSPFKRFALRRHFFKFDELTPDSIPFWYWFAAWTFLILTGLFFVYWILLWAATHGPTTSIPWFYQFLLFVIQEIFIHQCLQIYLVDILAIELLRPQLAAINEVLIKVARSKFHLTKASDEYSNSIAQHISGKFQCNKT